MNIAKEVYRYIEYELAHYESYKMELELERERIIESSPYRANGMPPRCEKSDSTCRKAILLMESTAVLSLERRIGAVDRTLMHLSETHRMLFDKVYNNRRSDYIKICMELNISKETFSRYKKSIIYGVGNELGLISVTEVC